MRLRVRRSGPLRGRSAVAGDLHIGQQALLWAALAEGRSRIENLQSRSDCALWAAALRALGVRIELEAGVYIVDGVGLDGLRMPRGALHAGDSATTLELAVALLAPQRFGTRVEAGDALAARSLRTLVLPLRERGANVRGRHTDEGDVLAPVAVAPVLPGELGDAEIAIPAGDPVTKLALLVSGLYARGVTAIREGLLSRDHAERALLALGVPIETAGGITVLDASEPPAWSAFTWSIPGDFTMASMLVAAALAVEGSDVRLDAIVLNPTRTAFLDALRGTGARVALQPKGDAAGDEPVGDLRVQSSRLTRVRVGGELAFRALEEVPALLALCAAARDRVAVRDVGALRTVGPDLLRANIELLARFGIACTVYEDGVEIDPPARIVGARIDAAVPPAQALLACVLGLTAEGETQIEAGERLDLLYPGFVDTLMQMGAAIEREQAE